MVQLKLDKEKKVIRLQFCTNGHEERMEDKQVQSSHLVEDSSCQTNGCLHTRRLTEGGATCKRRTMHIASFAIKEST